MAPILSLENISKRFGQTVIADNISMTVDKGEFFTFLGPSGSGKSTILRMVAGLDQPDRGRIVIAGTDVAEIPPWNRNLGMVFQQYAIFPHMTVAKNVAYGLKARKLKGEPLDLKVAEMLKLVGLTGMENKNPTLLSGGEQQRVALARALAPQPSMLLLDEPLSALDEKIRREMQTELKHIQRKTATTFLYVTHDQEEALTMSDRIAVLNSGSCVQCDAPEKLYRRPRTRFVAHFFRGCNVVDADVLEIAGNKVRVRFGGQVFEVAAGATGELKPGKTGIAIRAENLRLTGPETQYRAKVQAHLREIVYRGTHIDYLLELDDGQRLTATATRRYIDAPPRKVTVSFDTDDLIILED
jgi:ABC-type Fe3+/spermidine/putrescine transport system ATPase subunit